MAPHSGEMVKAAMKTKRMTQTELARRIGRDQTLISRYLAGQIEVSEEAARSIAKELDIDFEELRRQLQADKLAHQMERLRAAYREVLEEEERGDTADKLVQVAAVTLTEIPGMIAVPLLDSISSEMHDESREKAIKYVLPPGLQVDAERSFALRISRESMTDDKVDEGDIIMVDPGAEVRDDDSVLVILRGEPVLRKIYRTGKTIVLQSSQNREEPVIFLSQKDDFKILGKVVSCVKLFA